MPIILCKAVTKIVMGISNFMTFDGIDKNLVCWRQLNNSLSASSFQKIKDGYTLYKKHLNFGFLLSLFCVVRLSFYALKKKITMYS
mgnify:CR=1 FL=1